MVHTARLTEVDLFRFIAACAVVIFHWAFNGPVTDETDFEFRLLGARYGKFGVEFFFLLSGFVISMSAEAATAGRFMVSRALRLYPAFWICCSLSAGCAWLLQDADYQVSWPRYLANMTMLQWAWGVPPVDRVYWTLAVEMKFYALVAALLVVGQFRRFEVFLWAWLLVCAGLRLGAPGLLSRMPLNEYGPYFIGGAVCCLLLRGATPSRVALLLGAWLLALLQVNAAAVASQPKLGLDAGIATLVVTGLFGVMAAVAAGAFRRWRLPAWSALGMLTYPLYLLHQNIGYMVLERLQARWPTSQAVLFTAAFAAFIALAWIVHRGGEAPLARWLSALLGRRRSPPVAVTEVAGP